MLSLGITQQIEIMGIVNGATYNGICQGGVGKAGVPTCHRDMESDDAGRACQAVIKHFQQVLRG